MPQPDPFDQAEQQDSFFADEEQSEEVQIVDPVLQEDCHPLDKCFDGTTPLEEAVWTLRYLNGFSFRLISMLFRLSTTTVIRLCRGAETHAKTYALTGAIKKRNPRKTRRGSSL